MIPALIFTVLAISCYSCSQLQQHGKLRWGGDADGYWDSNSDKRKYQHTLSLYKTLLVWLTDGYHLMQFMFFNFLSLSITFGIGFNWWILLTTWTLIHITHWAIYNTLSK